MSDEFFLFKTVHGDVKVKLRHDAAPKTCERLKQMVKEGLYKDCVFYRAEPEFVVQGGLTKKDGKKIKSPFGGIPLEYKLENKRGTVTMARWEDPDCADSEFFFNLKDSPHLDRTGDSGWQLGFTVFGEVVEGMEVVDEISKLETKTQGGLKMLVEPIVFDLSIV
mmetsp:Transcript_8311/g.14346  ORF Transcript_8311/g.14346 Transcript_8311/m.14346 type:complete len:165 (+) Transcript_8311:58-552(+)|eukprot:CAMPEP_0168587126 /NCGR_PEP_ID=MMETSP0420-20121227/4697_1 /TAXON_ID=498008 /ORGANISM="Pessonella sp." /LENGTH=164 /DNA_ID=CAMNT_0008622355 /DNA_START=49 /DNA_END=543 /DNA_ORIENTATION=+